MKRLIPILLLAAAPFLASVPAGAETPLPVDEAFALEVTPARDGGAALNWEIAPGYYLYREFTAAEDADGTPIELDMPAGTSKTDETFGEVEVYFDSLALDLPATEGEVALTYQGCQDGGLCYPPKTVTIRDGRLAEAEAPAAGGSTDWTVASAGEAGSDLTLAEDDGLLAGIAARGGPVLVLATFFGFGLLLAFTPCVFPMMPIVLGMLSAGGAKPGKGRSLALTGAYALAMAGAFALLGIAAALTGRNLQFVLQSPPAILAAAAIFVAFALTMFGVFEIALPSRWATALSGRAAAPRASLLRAAGLGFTSALILSPCVTAPLAGALIHIAQTADVALGAGALFALGLGQGVPLMAVGVLGTSVLPRAGAWMQTVKQLFGFIFLAMSVWLVGRVVSGPSALVLWAALAIGAGVLLGGRDRLEPDAPMHRRLSAAAGLGLVLAGAILGIGAASGADDPLRPLSRLAAGGPRPAQDAPPAFASATSPQEVRAALRDDAPALVYVTADWCVTCRGIERKVLPDPKVAAALDGLTLVKADVTRTGAGAQGILDRLGAVGPPTMIFLDAAGRETEGSRLIGSIDTEAVIRSAASLGPRPEAADRPLNTTRIEGEP